MRVLSSVLRDVAIQCSAEPDFSLCGTDKKFCVPPSGMTWKSAAWVCCSSCYPRLSPWTVLKTIKIHVDAGRFPALWSPKISSWFPALWSLDHSAVCLRNGLRLIFDKNGRHFGDQHQKLGLYGSFDQFLNFRSFLNVWPKNSSWRQNVTYSLCVITIQNDIDWRNFHRYWWSWRFCWRQSAFSALWLR